MFDHEEFKSLLTLNQQRLIGQYVDELKIYNDHTNIYSKKSYDRLNDHIYDSISLSTLIKSASLTVDFGSGSGLPAIIVAICNGTSVICVESKLKKRLFLKHVVDRLKLTNVTVFDGDVQLFSKMHSGAKIDAITAKAFAKPPKLIWYLSMLSKQSLSKEVSCWVPVSDDQLLVLKQIGEVVQIQLSGSVFNYFKIDMSQLKVYKASLRNQYNL